MTYTISYGISKEIVDEEISVQAYELTYQMTEGVEFLSESIGETYSASITNDATVSMNYDINVTYTVPCNA